MVVFCQSVLLKTDYDDNDWWATTTSYSRLHVSGPKEVVIQCCFHFRVLQPIGDSICFHSSLLTLLLILSWPSQPPSQIVSSHLAVSHFAVSHFAVSYFAASRVLGLGLGVRIPNGKRRSGPSPHIAEEQRLWPTAILGSVALAMS